MPEQFKQDGSDETLAGSASLKFEERDIEAPQVFSASEPALWDGKPSFGGVWAAYPGDTPTERVVINNDSNGKSVVGALFKMERDNPGPKIRLSSDAANALGVQAGTPTDVTIVAIRRQPVQVAPDPTDAPVMAAAPAAADPIETEILTETLASAIDAAPVPAATAATEPAPKPRPGRAAAAAVAAAPADPAPAPAPAPSGDMPAKPFIQVATLTSEANASTLEKKLADAGISSLIRVSQTSAGKSLYRVLAGPATSQDALRALSERIAGLGFSDAFPVTN